MNPSVKSTRENSLLDLLKFICAYLVVAVHSTPVETAFGMAVLDAVHMAVPPFFMISGYLLRGNGEPLDATRFRARIVRLLKMTAIWMLVYLCASTLLVFVGRGWIPGLTAPRAWYRQLTSVETWLKFVLIQFVPGIGYHLWYLPASIIGLLLLGAVHRLHLQKCSRHHGRTDRADAVWQLCRARLELLDDPQRMADGVSIPDAGRLGARP